MNVYVLYSADLDFRDSIIGVFTDEDEALKCADYNYLVNHMGGLRIEEMELQEKFEKWGDENYG